MTEQDFKDVVHVLQYVLTKIPATDSVSAAMARLAPPPVPKVDLEALKTRRSQLVVQRARIGDKKRHLNEIASKPNVHWTTKRTADQANTEYDTVCKELAEVETAIREAA